MAQEDPTHTKALRQRYASRLRGAFSNINTAIREGIVEEDVLGLQTDALVSPPDPFTFTTNLEKANAFSEWLEETMGDEVLELIDADGNRYIRSAYERGLIDANEELAERGYDVANEAADLLQLPVHDEKLKDLYTRNYDLLDGITSDTANAVREELTRTMAAGEHPTVAARRITDRVDSIGKTRATTLARTEVIRSHADAKLNHFESSGLSDVVGEAEISTANDSRVCEQCAGLHSNRYKIREARGIIPIHPNCRCTFLPVTDVSEDNPASAELQETIDSIS